MIDTKITDMDINIIDEILESLTVSIKMILVKNQIISETISNFTFLLSFIILI